MSGHPADTSEWLYVSSECLCPVTALVVIKISWPPSYGPRRFLPPCHHRQRHRDPLNSRSPLVSLCGLSRTTRRSPCVSNDRPAPSHGRSGVAVPYVVFPRSVPSLSGFKSCMRVCAGILRKACFTLLHPQSGWSPLMCVF